MENTLAYRLWQAPFRAEKFAPILAHNDMTRIRRVLDVGCGPGTNTQYFAHGDYIGIDMNAKYIEDCATQSATNVHRGGRDALFCHAGGALRFHIAE
jgi:trans-aconitate methyltransferase